jgi:hypothetical protein
MKRLCSLFVFFFILFSCNNDEDDKGPVVSITEPGQDFEVFEPDTLEVKFQASDDQNITSVFVTIVNQDNQQVVAPEFFTPSGKDFSGDAYITLTDKALESAFYSIQVTATDGTNTTNAFLTIFIHELPKVLTGYIAVTAPNGLKSVVTKLNPDYETDTQFVINNMYQLAAINSMWEQFFFITNEPSVLTSYDITTFEPLWDDQAYPPRPLITDIVSDQDLIYSSDNGDVTFKNENGITSIRTESFDSKTITHLSADDTYIYATHVSLSGDIHELTVYYRKTGAIREQKLLSGEVADLVAFGGLACLFMPSGPDISIMVYNPETMLLNQATMIYNQTLNSATSLADKGILLLTETSVMTYHPSNNNFSFFSFYPYAFARYDDLEDIVLLAKENHVSRFNRVNGDLVDEFDLSYEVVDLQVIYNK